MSYEAEPQWAPIAYTGSCICPMCGTNNLMQLAKTVEVATKGSYYKNGCIPQEVYIFCDNCEHEDVVYPHVEITIKNEVTSETVGLVTRLLKKFLMWLYPYDFISGRLAWRIADYLWPDGDNVRGVSHE